MRIVGEVQHPSCKITFYHWNNRYLIKLERGRVEQTFKVDQFDIASEQDLTTLVSPSFIQEVNERFNAMEESLAKAIQNL